MPVPVRVLCADDPQPLAYRTHDGGATCTDLFAGYSCECGANQFPPDCGPEHAAISTSRNRLFDGIGHGNKQARM